MGRKVTIKSAKEIKALREGGRILAEVLMVVAEKAKEAAKREMPTKELDLLADKLVRKAGGEPSFLGYTEDQDMPPYPASLCVSLNHEIVHGIPRHSRIIRTGDLVKLDFGVRYKGLYTDAAVTVGIGTISPTARKLMEVTKRSLEIGIEQIYPGSNLGNYGNAVEKYVKMNGFSVVRRLVGHGVGHAVHEPPEILNYGKVGKGIKLKPGMVLALEPMVNAGHHDVVLALDGFTFETMDSSLSAHFEHTVVVTDDGCEVITSV